MEEIKMPKNAEKEKKQEKEIKQEVKEKIGKKYRFNGNHILQPQQKEIEKSR